MKPVVIRFVVMAVLFCGWLGYLYYLYLHLPASPNGLPPILSRSQFLVSDLDVTGDIEDEDRAVPLGDLLAASDGASAAMAVVGGPALFWPVSVRVVKVHEVLYPPNAKVKAGGIIGLTRFEQLALPGDPPVKLSQLGSCLLPLRSLDGGLTWQVTPLPPSPTFGGQRPRIYPDDKETRAQYRQIAK